MHNAFIGGKLILKGMFILRLLVFIDTSFLNVLVISIPHGL